MQKPTFALSFAGTNKPFARVQIRPATGGCIHLQGKGANGGNRDYGIATEVAVPSDFYSWLKEQEPTLTSLAGTKARYVPAQVRLTTGESQVRFQIGGTEGNREYGFALHFDADAMPTALVDWLRANKVNPEEDGD